MYLIQVNSNILGIIRFDIFLNIFLLLYCNAHNFLIHKFFNDEKLRNFFPKGKFVCIKIKYILVNFPFKFKLVLKQLKKE
jgi:hypothetical protein